MKKIEPFLTHILESIDRIERFCEGYDFARFSTDEKTSEAVIRQLEVIGEAITHLEQDFKQQYPDIPWGDITGMRNHLIHEYWDVNLEDVWQTVIEDVPVLKQEIKKIVATL